MASKSAKYLTSVSVNNKNLRTSQGGQTALLHSTQINLDPMLMASESGVDRIYVIYFKEGRA